MIKMSPEARERLGLGLILAATLLAGLLLLNPYLGNADLVQYISIAQKYLRGDLAGAVNAYWSPLFSWLLMPFLALGLDPIVAAKLLSHLTGLLFLIGAYRLSRQADLSPILRLTVQLILAPFILLGFAFIAITPDILMAGIVFLYLSCLFNPLYPQRPRYGVYAGLFGGLAYLAKHYAIAFFFAHFILFNIFQIRSAPSGRERRRAASTALLGLAVFLAVSAPYITAISLKSGGLTLNTSGALNWKILGSPKPGHAHDFQGFIPPAGPSAVSDWENPDHKRLSGWNPLDSLKSLRLLANRLKNNFVKFLSIIWSFSPLAWPILAVGLVFAFRKNPGGRFIRRAWWAAAIFTSGLILLLPLDRYLLPTLTLVVLMGAAMVESLLRFPVFSRKGLRAALVGVFLVSFLVPSVPFLMRHTRRAERFFIDEYKNTDVRIYTMSKWIGRHIAPPPRSRFASNLCWQSTMYLAYYLDAQYYGIMRKNMSEADLQRDLRRYGIEYFFLWFEPPERYPFLKACREYTRGRFDDLHIFRLNHP